MTKEASLQAIDPGIAAVLAADFPARRAVADRGLRTAAQPGPEQQEDRVLRKLGSGRRAGLLGRLGAVPNKVPDNAPGLSGMAVFFYVFLPFALAHFLSTLLRNVNAVLAPSLLSSLALTPAQLGVLTSAFFLSFALAHLPVGIALDRYGPRKVQPGLILVAALGAVMFAYGQSYGQLVVARMVMGFGMGGCFMAAVKAVSAWISPARVPSVQGTLIAIGGLGAAAATTPVRLALHYTDWRALILYLGVLTACSALLILLICPASKSAGGKAPTVRSIFEVCRNPVFRDTISLVLVPHMVFYGIQGLWIGRWLSDVAGFSDSSVAFLLYLGMAASIFGAVAVGMLTEWTDRRGIAPLNVAAGGVALFVLVQTAMVFSFRPSMQVLSVLFTLIGAITGIEFAIVTQSMPKELTGRAATCLNLFIFTGAFLVQAGFSKLVGLWEPDSSHHYPNVAYQVAFGVLVLLQLPGLVRYFRRSLRQHALSPRLSGCRTAE